MASDETTDRVTLPSKGNEGTVKISVAIPVRNGADYLSTAISTALSAVGPRGEVVVSLNACTDESELVAGSFDDPRLIVIRTPSPMSMSAHWEFVIQRLRGEWIVFIGHDDAVIPNLTWSLEQIESRFIGVDAILFRRAMFFWPGLEDVYPNFGWRFAANFSAKVIRPKLRLLKIAIGDGSYQDLPMIYSNCLIHRSLVERVKRDGAFFRDLSPDVYSSVAISLSARKTIYSGVPTFWVGTSPSSNGLSFSKYMSPRLPAPTADQEQRAVDFLRESASDGYSLGLHARQFAAEALSDPLMVLSAIENCPQRPLWTRGAIMRRFLLEHDYELNGRRPSLDVARLPFQAVFAKSRHLVKSFFRAQKRSLRFLGSIRRRLSFFSSSKSPEPREVVFVSDNLPAETLSRLGTPVEINRYLSEQGVLERPMLTS